MSLAQIKKRNERVEQDKAWEVSTTRKLIIAMITYAIIVIFLIIIGVQRPFLSALVPVLGYLLSTLTMPFCKNYWLRHFYKRP